MREVDRQREIRRKLSRMEQSPGKGGLVRTEAGAVGRVAPLRTGFYSLDEALGVGGFPRGSIVEVFGPSSSGKTTLALQAVAAAQRCGAGAAWVDADRAFDPEYASRLGAAIEALPVVCPESAEEALEMTRQLALSGLIDLLVVDSAAALTPRLEFDMGLGAGGSGLHSRVMASALPGLAAAASRGGACLLFLNQTRERPDSPESETSAGGSPLKLGAAVRVSLHPVGRLAGGAGVRVRVRVMKNKWAEPFREVELELRSSAGFSREADLLQAALRLGLAGHSAAGFVFGAEALGRTGEQARLSLERDPVLRARIEAALEERLGFPGGPSNGLPDANRGSGEPGPGGGR